MPLPLLALTICLADHSKKPISSNIKEMMITATKANVAFQTISATSMTSPNETTPVNIARTAPIVAVIQISIPFACHMLNTNVSKNIIIAKIFIRPIHLYPYICTHIRRYPAQLNLYTFPLLLTLRHSICTSFYCRPCGSISDYYQPKLSYDGLKSAEKNQNTPGDHTHTV